jgi:hypothetical protein
MSNEQKQNKMETTIKVIKARNKKYNNKVFTFSNCTESLTAGVNPQKQIEFKGFEFNGKKYDGTIRKGYNGFCVSMWCGNGIINFDIIELI